MGRHEIFRGEEESTYAANGGKQNPIHQGKHRAEDKPVAPNTNIEGHSLGSRKGANPKYTQENG